MRENDRVRPAGIHHVAICVGDVDAAREWYCGMLGFSVAPRPDELGPGYWLEAGGQQVHLMQVDGAPPPLNHFAVRVDDVDAAAAELRARGVEVNRIPLIPGSGHQAFLHDPFGNFIELNQPE
jgi:glyoxylase I family protein